MIIIEIPAKVIQSQITPLIIKIVNKLLHATNNHTSAKNIQATKIHHRILSPIFFNLKLFIIRRIHSIIAQIHNKTTNAFKIVSQASGKQTNKTQIKIWAAATTAKSHLSLDSLSCTAKTTHAIHDMIDSIQKTIRIVSNARFGLNIIKHQNAM
jgi:hypothetical protein